MNNLLLVVVTVLSSGSCSFFSKDYSKLSTFDDGGNLRVVIQNTRGDQTNLENDTKLNSYSESTNLKLSYPSNKGFIPSTITFFNRPLEAFIIGKNINKGEILTVKPIGILKCRIENILSYKIVVVPTLENFTEKTIANFEEFSTRNLSIRKNISNWMLKKYKNQNIQLLGWYDEAEALSIIKENQVRT